MPATWEDMPEAWKNAPSSYKDPYWTDLAKKYASSYGVPESLMLGVLLNGEKSNADQVSSEGAKTPWQFVPGTRQRFIDNYKIDPWASPEAATEAAALHLRESLDRNRSLPETKRNFQAAAEYYGGPNWKERHPEAFAYARRVVGPTGGGEEGPGGLRRSPLWSVVEQRQEQQTAAKEASRKEAAESMAKNPPQAAVEAPDWLIKNYQDGKTNNVANASRMTRNEMAMFERDIANGAVRVPSGLVTGKTDTGIFQAAKELWKGEERQTERINKAQDWSQLPEFEDMDMRQRFAVLTAGSDEAASIITSLFPKVAASKDERGNVIFKSGKDGKEYGIKPGAQTSDLVRLGYRAAATAVPAALVAAGGAGLVPAVLGTLGRAAVGAGLGAVAEEALVQTGQALQPGGEFNPEDVAMAGATGVALPVAGRVLAPAVAPAVGAVGRAGAAMMEAVPVAAKATARAAGEALQPLSLAAQMRAAVPEGGMAQPARMAAEQPIGAAEQLSRMRAAPPGMMESSMPRPSAIQRVTPQEVAQAGAAEAAAIQRVRPEQIQDRSIFARATVPAEAAAIQRVTPEEVARAGAAQPEVFRRVSPEQIAPVRQAIAQAVPEAAPQAVDDLAEFITTQTDPRVMDTAEIARLTIEATKGGAKGQFAKMKLAEQMEYDADAAQRAADLGFDLPEEFFVNNRQMRALAGLEASQTGKPQESIIGAATSRASQTADDLLKNFDAKFVEEGPALGQVSENIAKAMTTSRKAIREEEKAAYNAVVPKLSGRTVPVKNVRAYLQGQVDKVGIANLSPEERKLYNQFDALYEKYDALELVKHNIERAVAKVNAGGPYVDFTAIPLFGLKQALLLDQMAAAGSRDIMGEAAPQMAKMLHRAHRLTAQRKALENRIGILFGKEMDGVLPMDVAGRLVSALAETGQAGGYARIRRMMQMIPAELRKEALATTFAQAVRKPGAPGVQIMGSGTISPARFLSVYNGIKKSPFAPQFFDLMGPKSKEILDVVQDVMGRIYMTESSETKKTGKALARTLDDSLPATVVNKMLGMNAVKAGASSLAGFAGGAIGTVVGAGTHAGAALSAAGRSAASSAAAGFIEILTSNRAISTAFINLFRNPEFKKLLVSSAKGPPTPAAVDAVANLPQLAEYADAVGVPKTLEARRSFLYGIFEIGVPSAAISLTREAEQGRMQ